MKIVIGADHAGLELKNIIKAKLTEAGYELLDVGAHEYVKTDDYPDFAESLGRVISSKQADRGILLCGSGVGASIAANKVKGVRACLCHDIYSAAQGVEHDDMNVICIGGQIVGPALAWKLVMGFISAEFLPEERFIRRLNKVLAIEAGS